MRVIGLTGGIGTGKTTVAQMLRSLGMEILDADLLAREVVAAGSEGLQEIARRFPGVVQNGQLDRAALAARVFNDPTERTALNDIVHPRVRQLFAQKQQALANRGVEVLIYDVPLLFETGLDQAMDGIIVVTAPPEVQLARIAARDGMTPEQARDRIAAQLPQAEKVRRATWVIDNSGTPGETEAQVRKTWQSITQAPK